MSPPAITDWPESCRKGLTEECFKRHPLWARQMFAQRMLRSMLPPWLSQRLQELHPALLDSPGLPAGPSVPPPASPPSPPGIGPGSPNPAWPPPPGPPHLPSLPPADEEIEVTITAQNDGRQGFIGWDWASAHGATDGSMSIAPETETDQAIRADYDGMAWNIIRSFFDFDLSSIPASASIIETTLTLQSYGANNCNASIQQGTQSDSLAKADYDAFTGSYFGTRTWVAGANVFTLNAAGLTYIQSVFGDKAKLCMREYDHDYLNDDPVIISSFKAGCYWSGAVAANRPILTVTYTA